MYEKKYHSTVHKNLLENEEYYSFRAKCADKDYWKYLQGRVLEFGCGLGQNIFLHKENSIGIEISEFALEVCKKNGIRTIRDIRDVRDNSLDGILCIHVLEHLVNPYEIIEEFHRVLKKSSRLVIALPHSKRNKPFRGFKSDIAKHFYTWNFGSMNEILINVGFTVNLNKFNYAYGYSKFYSLPFKIATVLLVIFGRLAGKKEMVIVAEK